MAERYLYEINSIDTELKRVTEHTKALKLQRSKAMSGLYSYMTSNNLQKVGEGKNAITINKCAPKIKKKTKPKKYKRDDAINLFRDAGIPDPESFYLDFEKTQKSVANNCGDDSDIFAETSKRGKKSKDVYDASLGF
jgi:hypothetical protein